MGMSRNKPFHIQPENGNTSGPLYVEHLYKAGIIGEDKFSFYFTEPGTLSWHEHWKDCGFGSSAGAAPHYKHE